jgi:membrane protein implicated in regulation of membrane protease activity
MESLFSGIEAWQIWVIVGIILCIVEIFTPGFFLMALGAGCFVAAVGSLYSSLNWQIVFFVAGSIIFFFGSRKLFLPRKSESKDKFGMERLLGKSGSAIGEITSDSGYVKVGGEKWPARTEEDMTIPDSTTVEIFHFDGNRLIVRKTGR